jgi:aspartate/methionine/tyrosine aminotransferase
MKDAPVNNEVVDEKIRQMRVSDIGNGTIREIVALVNRVEEATGFKYIRMEMGVPGLPPEKIGIEAEIEALNRGVASIYPMIEGIKPLKQEASDFIKNFMNVEVNPEGCIPTVGVMQATYATFMAVSNLYKNKDTILFIDPGFPVQKQQLQVLGQKYETFDVFNFRGKKLREKLESYLVKGNICSIVYSNPNNPTWICLTEEELQIIGELANQYEVLVLEDLAYFAMDFRKDLSKPGEPPYQPTVAHYTDRYILFISGSKIFSYAGQRIGLMAISNALFGYESSILQDRFQSATFGSTVVLRLLYALSSGTCHSAQWALAAMLKAANEGRFNFVESVQEYGERAKIIKQLFLKNGFILVYDMDLDEPIADGFYFSVGYPGMKGNELVRNLLYYGVSAIGLSRSGSKEEGIRACVSFVQRDQFEELDRRLRLFNEQFR